MLKIELTNEQLEQLAPLFEKVRAANRAGELDCIGAQLWQDGMVVRVFKEDQGRALSAALGGHYERITYSAADRMENAYTDAAEHSNAGVVASPNDQGENNG